MQTQHQTLQHTVAANRTSTTMLRPAGIVVHVVSLMRVGTFTDSGALCGRVLAIDRAVVDVIPALKDTTLKLTDLCGSRAPYSLTIGVLRVPYWLLLVPYESTLVAY